MKKKISFIAILATLFYAGLAYSYTPASYVLIKNLLKQFSFDNPVRVEQDVYKNGGTDKEFYSNAEVMIKYPFTLKVTLNSNLKREYIVQDDDIIEINDNTIISFKRNATFLFYELFSFDNIDDFLRYLTIMKIDQEKVTMGLIDREICYVIGSDNLNEYKNQLWIDKKTLLPKKLVIFYSDNGETIAFRYEFTGYDAKSGLYFPKNVRFYHDDKLKLEFAATKITRTVIDDDSVFNTKKIRKEYKIDIAQ